MYSSSNPASAYSLDRRHVPVDIGAAGHLLGDHVLGDELAGLLEMLGRGQHLRELAR